MAEGGQSDQEFLDASDVVSYCYKNCKRTDSAKLIGCDGDNCDIEWFHVECVGLSPESVPTGGWTCPPCALTLTAQQRAFQEDSADSDDIQPDVKAKPAKKRVPTKLKEKGKVSFKKSSASDEDYSLSKFLPPANTRPSPSCEMSAVEKELEQVKRRQAELELKIAQAKLKKTEEELASIDVGEGKTANGNPSTVPKKEVSDIEVLLRKLYGKDSDDSEDEEETGKRRKKKDRSGLYKKASDKVKIAQAWPHLSLGQEYSGKILGFNDLRMSQFVAGELEIISHAKDESEKNGRLAFLKALMYDAVGCKYSSILNYYAAWVREIELGKKQWGDDFTKVGDAILKRAALPDSGASGGSKKKTGKKNKIVWYCSAYNRGACSKASPHSSSQKINGVLREVAHICATCYMESKTEANHPENSRSCPLFDSCNSDK